MIKISDISNADIEYLASAIIRDALIEKFKNLFGLTPVQKSVNLPMVIAEGQVPETVLNSVNNNIATFLKASAVENNNRMSGELPEIKNGTLLYSFLDSEPAFIPLKSVQEYTQMDAENAQATLSKIQSQGINIQSDVAYLDRESSGINIGVFVSNPEFAQEFSRRVENSGSSENPKAKTDIFDEFLLELPGGKNVWEENLRNELLQVVGLTSAVSDEGTKESINPAPGPDPRAKTQSVSLLKYSNLCRVSKRFQDILTALDL